MFKNLNLNNFWEDKKYAKEYESEEFDEKKLLSIEEELGYKLPISYIKLMENRNGGMPKNTCFPTDEETSYAENHIAINGILGIGRTKNNSLCGISGSQSMIDEWGYPAIGICICDCPSGGHDMVMLDYRKNGRNGEPEVIHVDQEMDFKITFLAKNFEEFILGLVHHDIYDT